MDTYFPKKDSKKWYAADADAVLEISARIVILRGSTG
jgi:hypothetical protein